MGVTHQARIAPFFDVATTATHFHGIARHLARVAASAKLDERRENAHQRVSPGVSCVCAAQGLCSLKHHGAGGFSRQQQLHQLALHQWQVGQLFAKSFTVLRDEQRFPHRTAHQARRPHTIGEAGVVDHVGHLHKAAALFAHQPGQRSIELNFTTGHGTRAQLVFQAHDAVTVDGTVGQVARQQEQRHAANTQRRVARARQHHRQLGIGVGAKPFVTRQPPSPC